VDCPHCGAEPLVALEYQRVEVDYCARCRGVWLDSGEIELLYGDAAAAREFLRSRNPVPRGEAPRKCPECGARMLKEATDGERPVVYDRCRKGHGLWLDQGELATVLEYAATDYRENEVARYLKDVFSNPNNSTA
jgi:Zn-finger nucleic acid-binding protein